MLDHRWAIKDNEQSVLVAAGKAGSLRSSGGLDGSDGASGEGERRKGAWGGKPWRWSVDLPRAWMQMVTSGVGYLLYVFSLYSPLHALANTLPILSMLAVMTFNVGYFLAVLGGVFLGELIFGRWVHGSEH